MLDATRIMILVNVLGTCAYAVLLALVPPSALGVARGVEDGPPTIEAPGQPTVASVHSADATGLEDASLTYGNPSVP